MRLLLALAGLAVGFAVPVLAQEQNAVDPQVRQEIEAVQMNFDEAFNKHDAAAIAALFTPDAVDVWDWEAGRTVSGQQAIEKRYAVELAAGMTNHGSKLVQVSAIGNRISAISEWSFGVMTGYHLRIYVRDADTWKIRMEYKILSMVPR